MQLKHLSILVTFGLFTAPSSSPTSRISDSGTRIVQETSVIENDPLESLRFEHLEIKKIYNERVENQIKLDSLLTIKNQITHARNSNTLSGS